MLEEETSRPEELPLAAFAVASELEWQQQQLELESKLLQHQASDQRETITSFPRPHRHGQSL